MKSGHVTLADVASRARVSVSTASRALAGLSVNKKNSASVQKAAEELGYVMNEAARSLRNVRSMTIGLVFHELTGPFGIELLSAVSAQFDTEGYCVFVATAQGDSERYDKLVHRLLERRVDALLCVHGAGTGAALERFISAGVPVVAVITKREGYDRLPLYSPTTGAAVIECVQSLRSYGHKHALVLRRAHRQFSLEHFATAASEAGMKVRVESLPDGPFDATGILELSRTGKTPPSVILAGQGEVAQLLEAAKQMNIAVPQTLSLVAVRDRTTTMPATSVPLSMIYLDPQKIGTAVSDSLLKKLQGGKARLRDTQVEVGSWLDRDTTGPVAAKAKR